MSLCGGHGKARAWATERALSISIVPAQIFIADRSPFSAVLYGSNGHLLEPVIREHLREVLQAADVLVFTVYLQVRGDLMLFHVGSNLFDRAFSFPACFGAILF